MERLVDALVAFVERVSEKADFLRTPKAETYLAELAALPKVAEVLVILAMIL
jgi:hypothetical protein